MPLASPDGIPAEADSTSFWSALFPKNETVNPTAKIRNSRAAEASRIRWTVLAFVLLPLALSAALSCRITSLKRRDRKSH